MYRKILLALENSVADESLLPHVAQLAKVCGSELLLVHVADGFAARHYDELKLAESDEIKADRRYLDDLAVKLRGEGLSVSARLAMGNPPTEILAVAEQEKCDLIAMTTHGHKLLADLFYGSTIDRVRHDSQIPLLIVRAAKKP